ncbi:hypothetical protein BgiMline_023220, partial [Biomphalaria glabrata]
GRKTNLFSWSRAVNAFEAYTVKEKIYSAHISNAGLEGLGLACSCPDRNLVGRGLIFTAIFVY